MIRILMRWQTNGGAANEKAGACHRSAFAALCVYRLVHVPAPLEKYQTILNYFLPSFSSLRPWLHLRNICNYGSVSMHYGV